jgi:alkyl sulfatase BDS1-like metallo-beta-lactamase superfamily hydrolase
MLPDRRLILLFPILLTALFCSSCDCSDDESPGDESSLESGTSAELIDEKETVGTDSGAAIEVPATGNSGRASDVSLTERCKVQQQKRRVLAQVDENVFVLNFKTGKQRVPQKNISWIETKEGVVVIDTGYGFSARKARSIIRKRTKKPVRFIIYTHHHGNHVGGTDALKGPKTKVIAHEDLPLEFDLAKELIDHHLRINSIQFNIDQKPIPTDFKIIYPDITYKSEYRFSLGGIDIELYHVVGEARDYTVIFLPAQRIVWVADLVGYGAPMVASPMKRVRDEVKWKQALELIKKLKPEVLVDSVHPPLCDRREIDALLDVRIDYLDFLHKAVFRELNQDSTLEEALANIRLPKRLASDLRVRDAYGSLEFNIRGLYHRYSGWFDRNGTHLKPAAKAHSAKHFIADLGGPERVIRKAKSLRVKGEHELALEYLDLLIAAPDHSQQAHQMKGEILHELSKKYKHAITSNMFQRLGKIEMEKTLRPSDDGKSQ